MKKGNDMKLNPPYYSRFKIEPIDIIIKNELNFCQGNVVKYIHRYPYKGQPIEDLKKAISNIQKLIKYEQKKVKDGVN